MDGSLGPQRVTLVGFQPGGSWNDTADPAPKLDATRLPEPEWSLSARQVFLVVIGIVAFCEFVGSLLQ